MASAAAIASPRAMLHPGPVVSRASMTTCTRETDALATCRYSRKSSLARRGPELETEPATRCGNLSFIQADREPG